MINTDARVRHFSLDQPVADESICATQNTSVRQAISVRRIQATSKLATCVSVSVYSRPISEHYAPYNCIQCIYTLCLYVE